MDAFEKDGKIYQFPRLLKRYQAVLIDIFLILILVSIIITLADGIDPQYAFVKGILLGIVLLYIPVFTAVSSTLGQRLIGIRIRRSADPNLAIGLPQAFLRFVIKTFLGWASFLTINFNAEHKAIHDLVSGSVVIKLTDD